MGKTPIISFDEVAVEKTQNSFIKELGLVFMPWIILGGGSAINMLALENEFASKSTILIFILAVVASLIKTLYRYPTSIFDNKNVEDILQEVNVSSITPVPCTLRGKLIGKGNPGYMFSEDFVLEDETGIIFMDYAQPLNIWNALFGLLKADKYVDKEVEVRGWYRRAPIPYFEIKEMDVDGQKVKCYSYITQIAFSIALIVVLGIWFLV